MKRLLTLTFAVFLALSLTACTFSMSKTMPLKDDFDEAYFHIQGSHIRVIVEAVDDKQVGYEFDGLKEHFRLLHIEVDDGALRVSLPALDAIDPDEEQHSTLYINMPKPVMEHMDIEIEGPLDFICAVNAKSAIVTVNESACQLNSIINASLDIDDSASVAVEQAETVNVDIKGESKLTLVKLFAGSFHAELDDQSEIVAAGQTMMADFKVNGGSSITAETLEFQDGNMILRDNSKVLLGKLYGKVAYDVDDTSTLDVLEIAE